MSPFPRWILHVHCPFSIGWKRITRSKFNMVFQARLINDIDHLTFLIRNLFTQAVSTLQADGAIVTSNIEAIPFDADEFFRIDNLIMMTELKENLNGYFASLPKASVRTLAELIQYVRSTTLDTMSIDSSLFSLNQIQS
jgi:hypothetical protein